MNDDAHPPAAEKPHDYVRDAIHVYWQKAEFWIKRAGELQDELHQARIDHLRVLIALTKQAGGELFLEDRSLMSVGLRDRLVTHLDTANHRTVLKVETGE